MRLDIPFLGDSDLWGPSISANNFGPGREGEGLEQKTHRTIYSLLFISLIGKEKTRQMRKPEGNKVQTEKPKWEAKVKGLKGKGRVVWGRKHGDAVGRTGKRGVSRASGRHSGHAQPRGQRGRCRGTSRLGRRQVSVIEPLSISKEEDSPYRWAGGWGCNEVRVLWRCSICVQSLNCACDTHVSGNSPLGLSWSPASGKAPSCHGNHSLSTDIHACWLWYKWFDFF